MTEKQIDPRILSEERLDQIEADMKDRFETYRAGGYLIGNWPNETSLLKMVRAQQEQIAALTDRKTAPYHAALTMLDCKYYDINDTMRAVEMIAVTQWEAGYEQGIRNNLAWCLAATVAAYNLDPTKSDEEYIDDIRTLLAYPPKEDKTNE